VIGLNAWHRCWIKQVADLLFWITHTHRAHLFAFFLLTKKRGLSFVLSQHKLRISYYKESTAKQNWPHSSWIHQKRKASACASIPVIWHRIMVFIQLPLTR
jgi:hypothetical protein